MCEDVPVRTEGMIGCAATLHELFRGGAQLRFAECPSSVNDEKSVS
jgi:hypothetical protein